MSLKATASAIRTAAEEYLPLVRRHIHEPSVVAWLALHGWEQADDETLRLCALQGMLNGIIQYTFPDAPLFATPLDFLPPHPSLARLAAEASRGATEFNFWGELYSTLIPQSKRRRIGQFWTEEHIAEWMITWLLRSGARDIADIGCGAGNFMLKAGQFPECAQGAVRLRGCDVSPLLLNVTLAALRGLPLSDLSILDYLDCALPADVDAIVCNPPYTRHHHIASALKDSLHGYFKQQFRLDVSRQATLAFHFLLKAIAELPDGGHAAFIVPMEVLDARYGRTAKRVICRHTTLSAIIHFSPQMNAFENVDVGASVLFFVKGRKENNRVRHVTLNSLPTADELLTCLDSLQDRSLPFGTVVVHPQDDLDEIPKWFSLPDTLREYDLQHAGQLVVPLKMLAKVVRGIATGANDFFALTTAEVERRALEPFVVRTLQRNREVQDIVLDDSHWRTLSDEGKRVWLLYLNGEVGNLPPAVRAYIVEGEARGYNRRSLVQTRRRWYLMEQRQIPDIFFTILTRGNPRFILNRAGVRPLNMFSLLYPNRQVQDAGCTEALWALLNATFSTSRLHSVSRTYGGRTLKVEPRELDNLPVINPLALSDEVRRQVRRAIDDFFQHRQVSVFIGDIDRIVDGWLAAPAADIGRPPLAVQPRLLEPRGEMYGDA